MTDLKKNVEIIRNARGLSEAELSRRLGMDQADLAKILSSPPKRKETLLHNLSHELLVPDFLLLADVIKVRDTRIPDFRLSRPAHGGYARETLRWIDFAESVQQTANEVGKQNPGLCLSRLIDANAPIPDAAEQFRKVLQFTPELQLGFGGPRQMFAALRQKIETLNVFVLQLSFPETDGTGFCLSGKTYDVIVLNTRQQSPARRSFTLAHEVYHCAIGETGLSDSRVANNAIERRCNSFAAQFLAPESLVRRVARDTLTSTDLRVEELRAFANTLNISMYASLLRLVELRIYDEEAVGVWKRYLKSQGDPDSMAAGGGRRVDEWKYKLAKYGFKFASVFGAARERGDFDDLEFFRFSGIKPKYQDSYIKNASRGRAEDADVDEAVDNG